MSTRLTLPRVEKFIADGKAVWIKRPEPPRSSRFVFLHKALERIMPKVLHHTGASGGMEAIQQEATRLRMFESASLPVPKILSLKADGMVLSDTGDQLRAVLRQNIEKTERYELLERAMESLRSVHNAGQCHGRPFLKDMTIDAKGLLYFIDLEEDPCKRMSFEDAQARDVWLLLSSCTEFCQNPLDELLGLLSVYKFDNQINIDSNLRALAKALRPYRWMISMLRIQNISKDITGAYWSTKVLEKI